MVEMRAQAASERDAAVHAAIDQAAVLGREQVGAAAQQARQESAAELGAKKDVIDSRLDQVRTEMRTELDKLGQMVSTLAEQSAQRFGQVDQSLRSHAEATHTLSQSAQALREAMASPTARGQWGERMAEDVLRLAGFVENVNYTKQTQIDGASGRPDFTFALPAGTSCTWTSSSRWPAISGTSTPPPTPSARRIAPPSCVTCGRGCASSLGRDYARQSARDSVDYVLMFLPNEQLTGFIHEHDPSLIDDAMNQRVVMCSPLTLFAFLGVIRQAYDNFVIEQTSDEILGLIGKFGVQWVKYNEQLEKVHAKFEQLDRQFDELMGPRRRQLQTAAPAARGGSPSSATWRSTVSCSPSCPSSGRNRPSSTTPPPTISAGSAPERRSGGQHVEHGGHQSVDHLVELGLAHRERRAEHHRIAGVAVDRRGARVEREATTEGRCGDPLGHAHRALERRLLRRSATNSTALSSPIPRTSPTCG